MDKLSNRDKQAHLMVTSSLGDLVHIVQQDIVYYNIDLAFLHSHLFNSRKEIVMRFRLL